MKTALHITGMTCSNCEAKVSQVLLQFGQSTKVEVNAARNQAVIHHQEPLDLTMISQALAENGYFLTTRDRLERWKMAGLSLGLLVLGYLVTSYSGTVDFDFLPAIRQNMGYGALFVVGLLTSIHCIAMCGAINVSQTITKGRTRPSKNSLLYNLGRMVSYTVIGGVVGGLGRVLSFSGLIQGYLTIAVSVMMLLMALRLLKLFQFHLPSLKTSSRLKKAWLKTGKKGPFLVGLGNGLMPCGPLQSLQLYALGSGSVLVGALSMFYFSLGTFPLMFGLGLVSSLLNHRFARGMVKVSALIIFSLSLAMFTRGAALAGIYLPLAKSNPAANSVMVLADLQQVRIGLEPDGYQPIVIKKGIPVSFIIDAPQENINGCNNPIIIPALGIEKTLMPGENEIRFTVDSPGTITYSCWMGMMTDTIKVVD